MNFYLPELPITAQQILSDQVEQRLATLMSAELQVLHRTVRELTFLPNDLSIENGVVCLDGHYPDSRDLATVIEIARELIPWRKGPFRLNDLLIDGEWRSDKKWARLLSDLPDLNGKIVADVGCNNGYYLFQLAQLGCQRVIGLDPTLKYWLQYQLIAKHAPQLPINFLPLGWDALRQMTEYFDCIFLMGVNYHEAQPMRIFHACKRALKSGGLLVCESVIVPGDENLEIFPAKRYAGIGGAYAIPTAAALLTQLTSCGFNDIKLQHSVKLLCDEQRSSDFSPQKSLVDFLSPDQMLSSEGYPAPYRAAIFATCP